MTTYQAGGVSLPFAPVMIGAGVCKSPNVAQEWLKVAPVVSGSYTPKMRPGNEGNRLFYPDTEEELKALRFGLNSFGMPNIGFAAAVREFASYEGEQPLVISIAGFNVEDYEMGVEQFSNVSNVSALELNFGCPNTGHGKIMSFDPETLDTVLLHAGRYGTTPIWAKFSPYSDPGLLREVAAVVSEESRTVKAVVTCNTFANAYVGADAISPMGGMAGFSGPALKPIALGQVKQFRQYLVSEVDVIGVGGVTTGNDVIDFLDAGASAVQVTSLPFWLGNPGRFWEALLDQETGTRLNAYLNNEPD